ILTCLFDFPVSLQYVYHISAFVGFGQLWINHIFAFSEESLQGVILYMLGSGLSTGLLFLIVAKLEQDYGSKDMHDYGGLKKTMPLAASAFLVAAMASVGLPGLSGFVGEFLILIGAFKSQAFGTGLYASLSAIGIILAVVYMLPLTQRLFFGETRQALRHLRDFNLREAAIATTMIIAMLWLGLLPNTVLKFSASSLRATIEHVKAMPKQAEHTQGF
ncbi:MAG: proton-conducting transporter membrane subunit, partial [Candidatus Thermochlorobacter sp.]